MKIKLLSSDLENEEPQYDPVVTQLSIPEPSKWSIDVLQKMRKKIKLQPDFQRGFVWESKKQKDLIKSIYRNIPIPAIYFAKYKNGKLEVIDGQQRLTTILGYLNENNVDKHLRKKVIKKAELKDSSNNKIEEPEIKRIIRHQRYIYCIEIPNNNLNLKTKYEIFQALNKGAYPLKRQEIRNCLFQSELPELNKKLKSSAKKLKELIKTDYKRMEAEEFVLRFFVINEKAYGENKVSSLLDDFELIKRINIREASNKYRLFIRRMKRIFDKSNFDSYFQLLKDDASQPLKTSDIGKFIFSGKINQGLFHLFAFYLPKYNENQFSKIDITATRKGFIKLLENNEFVSYVSGSGTDKLNKIRKAMKVFEKSFILPFFGDYTDKLKRSISAQEKETLYRNIPICYLCYGKIKSLNKCESDHIKSHKKGHDTGLNNTLAAHISCNRKKSAREISEYRMTPESIARRRKNKKNIEEYLRRLKDWNKAHPIDTYKELVSFAKKDTKS
ncbi:MAG: DUF262 domain-containing protein [Nitrospirae bacterium]|nr:DUF262 domain-containing protein [Nitrospirota bacterium]